jgi:hypothetical protein
MSVMPRGYDRSLYILPFDHRSSFRAKVFSPLSESQTAELASANQIIYDGFKSALAGGVPKLPCREKRPGRVRFRMPASSRFVES